jgi:hypothetical protein
MTDQGNDPTRVDIPAAGPQDAPTQAVPPVDPGPPTQVGVPPVPPPGPPPDRWDGDGGPPDRRPWILAGVLGLIALIAILLLVLGGDDGDDEAAPTTTSESTTTEATTTSESTTTTEAPTTTAPTTTASPSDTVDPVDCREVGGDPVDPDAAAQTVYDAWTRDDEACARELMSDAAFEELFARDGSDASDEFQGCTADADPEPFTDCAFTYEGGATHYRMVYSPTDGWQVQDISQVAD